MHSQPIGLAAVSDCRGERGYKVWAFLVDDDGGVFVEGDYQKLPAEVHLLTSHHATASTFFCTILKISGRDELG